MRMPRTVDKESIIHTKRIFAKYEPIGTGRDIAQKMPDSKYG